MKTSNIVFSPLFPLIENECLDGVVGCSQEESSSSWVETNQLPMPRWQISRLQVQEVGLEAGHITALTAK